MRVVHVVQRFLPSIGGIERHVYEVSKELARRGNEITVITTNLVNEHKIETGYQNYNGVLVSRHSTNFQFKERSISISLFRELLTIPADIIHAHGYSDFSSDAAALAARLRNIPLVFTSHGFYNAVHPLSKIVLRNYNSFFGRIAASTASKCIAVTENGVEGWRNLGVPSERIEVIPNGINLETYSNVTLPDEFTKKYMLDGKTIAFIGRLDDIKGPALVPLIRAFKKLLVDFSSTKLVIIGSDWGYLSKLKALTVSLGLKDSVIFTNQVSEQEKMRFLVASSIGVVLSTQEAFGITSLEFMAFGKPVIASKVGGLPYVVKDGYSGILVENDPDAIEKALRKLLSSVSYARKLGENGRKLVVSKYNWKSISDKLEKIYQECVEE